MGLRFAMVAQAQKGDEASTRPQTRSDFGKPVDTRNTFLDYSLHKLPNLSTPLG